MNLPNKYHYSIKKYSYILHSSLHYLCSKHYFIHKFQNQRISVVFGFYNSQLYGGPDGELGAAMRYLSQRYSNTNRKVAGVLTDIGTEELAHMEMICAIVHQLTKNLNAKELEEQGFAPYYIDHTIGIWPQAASGEPWSATSIQSTGDPLADMHEDMAAEQKARLTYDNILRLVKDPDVCDPIRFLRERTGALPALWRKPSSAAG